MSKSIEAIREASRRFQNVPNLLGAQAEAAAQLRKATPPAAIAELLAQLDAALSRASEVEAQTIERCALVVDALRDAHCAGTAVGDAGYDACSIDSPECEFVVAWNDAAAAIRSMRPTGDSGGQS